MSKENEKTIERSVVHKELSQDDPRYELQIATYSDVPGKYWVYIFREESPARHFWMCLNAGCRRIKPGGLDNENFKPYPPPTFSSLDEAICKGKVLLDYCVKNGKTSSNSDLEEFQHIKL